MNTAANRMYGATLTRRMEATANEVESLNRAKAPYQQQAMIIRCAKLPKALYGCEVAPVNETALRTLRTSISKTFTYTTDQRSVDLTFATASNGPDLDPESCIYTRRAVALRRFITKSEANARRVKQIIEMYKRQKEPGIHKDEEQLKHKTGRGPNYRGKI